MRNQQAIAFWNAFCLVTNTTPLEWRECSSWSDVIEETTAFEAAYSYLEQHESMRSYVLQESFLNFLLLCYEASS